MRLKNLTPQELCDRVYLIVSTADEPLRRLEICKLLGKKKSPHIIEMIEHLVDTGYFRKEVVTDAQWGRGYAYSLAPDRGNNPCPDSMNNVN